MSCLLLKTLLNARLNVNLSHRVLELEPFGRFSCLFVICCSELGIKHISDICVLLEVHDKQELKRKRGYVLSFKQVLCFHNFLQPMPIKMRTDLLSN